MAHLLTIALLYAALVAQVALRFGGAGAWTPSLVLLVGLAAGRRLRGGIIWAAAAGLICDSLTGRPLGVTMLAATLATAACGPASPAVRAGPWRSVAGVFLTILSVEASARILAATVAAHPDYAAEMFAATRAAAVTAAVALACWPLRRLALPNRRPAAKPQLSPGRLRMTER